MKKQNEILIDHLRKHKTITSIEAVNEYGITRLSARIFELRDMGYVITRQYKSGVNRFGDRCHWFEFRLVSEPEVVSA